MAFNAGSGKYFFQLFYAGGESGLKWWQYITTDQASTVDGSNYITDTEVIGKVSVGDLIWVYQVSDKDDLSAGITDISLHAVLVNTGSVVDLSDDLFGGAGGTFAGVLTYGD